jgi:hypothetical protein
MKEETLQIEDITPIPSFRYEPGVWEWGLLIFLLLVLISASPLIRAYRRWAARRLEDGLMREYKTIEPLLEQEPRQAAVRLSSIGKRFLTIIEPTINFPALTANELKDLRNSLGSELMRQAVDVLIALEAGKFDPNATIDIQRLYKDLVHHSTELAKFVSRK